MTEAVYTPMVHRMIIPDHYGGHMSEHLGLVLHVAEARGSLHDFFLRTSSPNRKSATWWVAKSGRIEQYVPGSMEAWAQADGNATYNSVETEGYSTEPFTLFQVAGLAFLMRRGHDKWHWPFTQAAKVGQRGLGIHSMGGAAWGGHSCPGTIRANERATILAVAEGRNCVPVDAQLKQEVTHLKTTHGLPHNDVIGPRVRALLGL